MISMLQNYFLGTQMLLQDYPFKLHFSHKKNPEG